jgi:hypothetical protein
MSGNHKREELLFLNFNQDDGCFACGTDAGFRIYNCDPFKETFRRRFDNGGEGDGLFRGGAGSSCLRPSEKTRGRCPAPIRTARVRRRHKHSCLPL